MVKDLKTYFPMLKSREEVLRRIYDDNEMQEIFESWDVIRQEEFLDMCTGNRGIRILYDQFFKQIFDPDMHPERLEELLSLILNTKVTIVKILPNDSPRIASEKTLLTMDIVVQLMDGSLANVEIQRIGYAFPGQRSACYSADLLLRQYKRVRSEKGKKFSYRDIKKVYTIVFFEHSTMEFHKMNDVYFHRMRQQSDTGIEVDLLQEYVFVALDIFKKVLHNKDGNINCKLEAWLTFLCSDDPQFIVKLIERYPQFETYYEEVYEMCQEVDEIMGLFSEELAILDSNTVDFMIDEMQTRLDEKRAELDAKKVELNEKRAELDAKKVELNEKNSIINEQNKTIESLRKIIDDMKKEMD